jgi:histidine triad (HIT) family protein
MATYDPENIFLKIIEGSVPSFKLFETEHVLAILDAFPLVPGHALLLPKARYATVAGTDG